MNNKLRVDDIINLEIKRIGINGEGIGFYKRQAVFVLNAIPKDIVKVRITSDFDNYVKAEIIEFIKRDSNHVVPACPYYGKCGGCQLQHVKYEYQGVLKREHLIECIERYSSINPRKFEIKPTIMMDNPFGYRNKSSLPVRNNGKKNVMGIYEADSNRIVYVDDCLIHNDQINYVNKKILEFMEELNIRAYSEKFNGGIVKYIVTRISTFNNEIQVTIILHEKSSKIYKLAEKIMSLDNVVSVYEDFNEKTGQGIIFGKSLKKLAGKDTITEKLDKISFELLPNAFFQLNPIQTVKLYNEVKKACKLSRKETVIDAYCGVGTIGMWLANMAKEVIGIELNREAVESANMTAKKLKIKNIHFYNDDVNVKLPALIKDGLLPDVVVFDPPRTGLDAKTMDLIMKIEPKRIVYVSCNPSSLAKDLNILDEKYKINYIQPIDMFPMTSHVECVCQLSLKTEMKHIDKNNIKNK